MSTKLLPRDVPDTGGNGRRRGGAVRDRSRRDLPAAKKTAPPAQPPESRKRTSVYKNVIAQFEKAARLMHLDPNIAKILAKSANEISVKPNRQRPTPSSVSFSR